MPSSCGVVNRSKNANSVRERVGKICHLITTMCCSVRPVSAARGLLGGNHMEHEDDLFAMSLNPRNIVGIYNYCDRWCERCPFTERCLVKASVDRMSKPRDQKQVDDPLVVSLNALFAAAREAMDRRWTGFELPEPSCERDPVDDLKEKRRNEERHNHPIVCEARAYSGLVDAWFETESSRVRRHAEALVEKARSEDLDDLPTPSDMSQVANAIQIVRHDQLLIAAKVYRALSGSNLDEEHRPWVNRIQNDRNGSAKVALLAMDRSEAAWRVIETFFPGSDTALLLANELAELRRAVEHAFPDARRFLRAGFDGVFPDD